MIKEAILMFFKSIRRKTAGYERYHGNAEEICRQIVKKCFNDRYFQVSTGHFDHFYVRDFAYCCESMIKTGYHEEVLKTLIYAMNVFEQSGRVATTITTKKIEDFFSPTPESLALMFRSLDVFEDKSLIESYRSFIEKVALGYYSDFYDSQTYLLRQDIGFSSIKDNAKRKSSTYNNSMLYLLSSLLDKYKFKNPFNTEMIQKAILDNLYNGEYFYDDMQKKKYFASDANIFPFWCGVVDDKKMFEKIMKRIRQEKLDFPYPIKYTSRPIKGQYMFPHNVLAPNYEGNTIWMHLGLVFLEVVRKYDSKQADNYTSILKKLVEKNKNFLEIFNPDGSIYHSIFYSSDESMVWAVMLLYQLGVLKR